RVHVLVHPLHPRHEAVQLARPAGLAHTVDPHAAGPGGARPAVLLAAEETAGEHVHRHTLAHQRFGELANVSREPTLDHGRVLPREEQHTVAHWCPLPPRTMAPRAWRRSGIIGRWPRPASTSARCRPTRGSPPSGSTRCCPRPAGKGCWRGRCSRP